MEKIEFSTSEISSSLEEIIKAGGHFSLCVSGSSMRPFLTDGRDIVRLRAFCKSECKRGNILLFKREDGTLVLHRVKRVLPDGSLIMNGDAQFWCETIAPGQAIAVVSEIERRGKLIACSSLKYRASVFLWQLLFPLRPLLFRIKNKINRMKKKTDK